MIFSLPITEQVSCFFREELRVARGVSPHTYRSYSISMRYLMKYLEVKLKRQIFDIQTDELTYELISQWIMHEKKSRGWSESTWNARLAPIKTFVNYLSKKNVRYLDLAARVELIRSQKRPQRQKDYMTLIEFENILKGIKTFKEIDFRDKLIAQILFFSGIRVAELTKIRLSDLTKTGKSSVNLFIHGKGRKERNVPLMEKATNKNLKKYIQLLTRTCPESEYLFPGQNAGRMNEENIRRIVRKHFRVALENKIITPHSFRHSAAMNWLEKGMGVYKVSILLGHEDIETTIKYLQATFKIKHDALIAAGQNKKISQVFETKFNSNDEFWEHLGVKFVPEEYSSA